MVSQISDILKEMNLHSGSGGTIVEIGGRWAFGGKEPAPGHGVPQQFEFDYNHALAFANAVYNKLNLPVKVYSKATPGAVYVDLKPREPAYVEKSLEFASSLQPRFTLGEDVNFTSPTFTGTRRGRIDRLPHGSSTDYGVSFAGFTYSIPADKIQAYEKATFHVGPAELKEWIVNYMSERPESAFSGDDLQMARVHDNYPAHSIGEVATALDDLYRRGSLKLNHPGNPANPGTASYQAKRPEDITEENLAKKVVAALQQSMQEERQAVQAYEEREERARVDGFPKVAELYRHIADEEDQHFEEFQKMLKELGG